MFRLSTIAAAFGTSLIISHGVSAIPTIASRSLCSPNAQGAEVSILSSANNTLGWGDLNTTPAIGDVLISAKTSESSGLKFHVAQSGDFPASYIITDANNNGLAVDSSNAGTLAFNATSVTGGDGFQLFDIACQTCGTDTTPGQAAGSSCTISPLGPFINACVRIGINSASSGFPLIVGGCEGSELQLFDIVF